MVQLGCSHKPLCIEVKSCRRHTPVSHAQHFACVCVLSVPVSNTCHQLLCSHSLSSSFWWLQGLHSDVQPLLGVAATARQLAAIAHRQRVVRCNSRRPCNTTTT